MTEYRKLLTSDILPLIYDYFNKINLKGFASKLQKMSEMDLENSQSPLAGKSLKKIIKITILQRFEVQSESEEEQEEEEEEEEEIVVPVKNISKQKRKRSTQSINSEASQPISILKKTKLENNQISENQVLEAPQQQQQNGNSTLRFFQRCDESRMGLVKQELKDNSFLAKSKFGQGGDKYGEEGWERLKDKRGKDFKKEKGKLKNKAFCGGSSTINFNVINSIKL